MSLDISPSISPLANSVDTTHSSENQLLNKGISKNNDAAQIDSEAWGSSQTKAYLRESVQNLNEFFSRPNRSVRFRIDEVSQTVVVSVMDSENEEIIRQIPNEKALKLSEYIDGVIGLLFDETV